MVFDDFLSVRGILKEFTKTQRPKQELLPRQLAEKATREKSWNFLLFYLCAAEDRSDMKCMLLFVFSLE